MVKILAALAIAWLGWWLWKGPRRVWTDGKRTPTRPQAAPASGREAEALAVLGLAPGAGEDEIRTAHRRLLMAVHPDRGGSADLTQRINAARNVLLRRSD